MPTAEETFMLPDEDLFRTLEVERTQALVARDVAAIRRLHSPEYELISVPGRVMSLERYLSLMAVDAFYARWEHGPMRVQVAESLAAVRYRARITFPSGKVVHCWHTDIYKLLSGSWMAVWSQATQLPPESVSSEPGER
ncbi:MAG: nuclear transport factor 2 family protein [Burkholderiaceae bacterium]